MHYLHLSFVLCKTKHAPIVETNLYDSQIGSCRSAWWYVYNPTILSSHVWWLSRKNSNMHHCSWWKQGRNPRHALPHSTKGLLMTDDFNHQIALWAYSTLAYLLYYPLYTFYQNLPSITIRHTYSSIESIEKEFCQVLAKNSCSTNPGKKATFLHTRILWWMYWDSIIYLDRENI